jgi:hypothetical protein
MSMRARASFSTARASAPGRFLISTKSTSSVEYL